MTRDDDATLICMPTRGRPDSEAGIAGSVRRLCAECGTEVFVSPTGTKLHARYRRVRVICVPCAMASPPGSITPVPMTPEQMREILENL